MYEQLLPEFLKQIEIGSRSLLMYSEKHPRAQQVIQQAYDGLNEALNSHETITVSIAEGNLLLEGQIVEKGNPVLDRLSQNLFSRSVHSLTFLKGLTRDELVGLMHDLALKPQRIAEMGGFEKVLHERGAKNIQVNKVKYGIISEGEAGAGAVTGQNIFPDLLLAVQGMLSGGTDAPVTAADLEKKLDASSGADSASILFRIFHMVAQRAPGLQVAEEREATEALRKRFAELFHGFTSAMQGKLLMSALMSTTEEQDDPLHKFYRDLTPEDLESSMLAMLEEPLNKEELRSLFAVMKNDAALTISEPVQQKFQELGLEEIRPQPAIWDEILAKPVFQPDDIRTAPGALAGALSQQKLTEADHLSKRIFSLLSAGTLEQKMVIVQILPAIVRILASNEHWKNIESSVQFLCSSCYRREPAIEIVAALQSMLLDVFETRYRERSFSVCEEIVRTIRSRQHQPEYLIGKRADRIPLLQTELLQEICVKSEGFEAAMQYLRICGPAGADFVLNQLADEEDSRVRANLIACIEHLDPDQVLPEIEKRISDPRWFVLRNLITILGKMNLSQTPAFLQKIALHPEPRVVKEIIKNIYKSPRRSDIGLLVLLLEHPDKTTRLQSLHLIQKLDLRAAAPKALDLARSSPEPDVRIAALQMLLQWKVPEIVPLAQSVLEKRSVVKTDQPERNLAVTILGKLHRDESRKLFESIAASDPNPETRALAASYL